MLIVTLFVSVLALGGIVFILWRKIPQLLEFSEKHESMGVLMADKAKSIVSSRKLKDAAVQNIDRTLSTARTLASKTERQTGVLVRRLKKNEKDHKEEFTESYWDQLRKRGMKK